MKQDLPLPDLGRTDPEALLRAIGARLDVRDLAWIAEADRGRDAAENCAALAKVRLGTVPSPLEWVPREVLELTRWDEPSPDDGPEANRLRHLHRAFACAVLLRSYGDPANASQSFGGNSTVVQLIDSLRLLRPDGIDFDREATSSLVWLLANLPADEPEEHAFFGLGLLWCALGPAAGVDDAALLAAAEWVMLAEDAWAGRGRDAYGVGATGPWLLTRQGYTQRYGKWRQFGGWLEARLAPRHGPEVADAMRLIAAMLGEPRLQGGDGGR